LRLPIVSRKTSLGLSVGLGLLLLSFGVGWTAGRLQEARLAGFPLASEVARLVRENYFGELPDGDDLGRGLARGFVGALGDPYSLLIDPPARELETDTLTGSYGGVGADLLRGEDGEFHLLPYADGPASRAGIVEADILLSIDETVLDGEVSHEEATALLRGPEGSGVVLGVRAPADGPSRQVRVVRETFPLPSVTSFLLPDDPAIVVIRISLFAETTPREVDEAIRSAAARGASAAIVDVRGTPGGLVESAVDTARLFLADGIVAAERDANGGERLYRVEGPGAWSDLPLVVVIDGTTASAAEILAGALRQSGRAGLVGEATVGKGSVQSIFPLSDGSSLHLTTAAWMLADGEPLPDGGLTPDHPVAVDPGDPDVILREAARWLRHEGWGE
jgi:carboxyl-terminal processing protease